MLALAIHHFIYFSQFKGATMVLESKTGLQRWTLSLQRLALRSRIPVRHKVLRLSYRILHDFSTCTLSHLFSILRIDSYV